MVSLSAHPFINLRNSISKNSKNEELSKTHSQEVTGWKNCLILIGNISLWKCLYYEPFLLKRSREALMPEGGQRHLTGNNLNKCKC